MGLSLPVLCELVRQVRGSPQDLQRITFGCSLWKKAEVSVTDPAIAQPPAVVPIGPTLSHSALPFYIPTLPIPVASHHLPTLQDAKDFPPVTQSCHSQWATPPAIFSVIQSQPHP